MTQLLKARKGDITSEMKKVALKEMWEILMQDGKENPFLKHQYWSKKEKIYRKRLRS